MAKKNEEVTPITLVNVEEVKSLVFASINGTVYFGKITEEDSKLSVKDAIVPSSDELKSIVKEWLIAKNNGTLKNPKIGGSNISYSIEEMNEVALASVDQFITSINLDLKGSLTNIANEIIVRK